jgi:hypothetical protein
MEIDEHIQLCSFDIENTYTNIPVSHLRNIISSQVNNATTNAECTEILNLLELIMEHNYEYIQHNDQYYKQIELAMGAATSAILAETYIQFLEHTAIANILNNIK